MDLQLTTKAQEAFSAAVRDAAAAGHPHVEPAPPAAGADPADRHHDRGRCSRRPGRRPRPPPRRPRTALRSLPAVSGSSVTPPQLSRTGLAVIEQARRR